MGGAQRQLYYLVSGLDRRRYEPTVVCRDEGPFVELLKQEGIESHVLSLCAWRKWPGSMWRFVDGPKLVRFARSKGIELVHGADLWQSGYARKVGRELKVPTVLHVRRPRSAREIRKHRVGHVGAVVAISQHVRADLLAGGVPADKIKMIVDAVDLDKFNPRLRKEDVLGSEFGGTKGIRVGIVGVINKSKKQLDFLRVARRIAEGGQVVTFFVVGEAQDMEYFQQLREMVNDNGQGGKVVFTGRREDVAGVLASLDVLVSLSGGSVMIEAMACGTPVISAGFTQREYSNIVQNEKTGLLVESNKEEELEAALRRLISEPNLRERMGVHGRKHVEATYGHGELVGATQKVYDELVAD